MMWSRRKQKPVNDEKWQQALDNPVRMSPEKKQALLQQIHQRIQVKTLYRRRIVYMGVSAAAAVLIAFAVRMVWLNKQPVPVTEWETASSNTEKRRLQLPDGSVIWLAPHSSMRLYPGFTAQRSVVLEKGTAFFTVTRDEAHPFVVSINRQQVKVLGTQFNISVKDTVDLKLVVKEGAVALSNRQGSIVVHGGEEVNTFGAIDDSIKTIPEIAADWWLQPQVHLYDVPIGELLDNITAYYHVKLNADGVKRKTKVTLTWNFTQPMEQNLAVLNQLTGNTIH